MKAKRLFVFLPLIALVSCSSLGKKITREEALLKVAAIQEKQEQTKVFSFSYSIITDYKNSKATNQYKYAIDEKGNYMFSRDEKETTESGVYKSTKVIYDVELEGKNRVLYVKTYDGATNTTKTFAYSSAAIGSEEVESAVEKQSAFIEEISTYIERCVYAPEKEMGEESYKDAHFYAMGEGNLTVQATYNLEGDKSGTGIESINTELKYSNNLFASYKTIYTTFDGKTRTEKARNSYNNVKVTIPADWDQYVVQVHTM